MATAHGGAVANENDVEARLARLQRTTRIDAEGMGEVWLATTPEYGNVVVKIFDLAKVDAPTLGARVRRALPFLRAHTCPNLPKTFDGGVLDSAVFLVFERIEGHSLDTLFHHLERGEDVRRAFDARGPRIVDGRFDPVDAARIAAGVLDALTAALDHRDVERDVPAPIVHGAIGARKVLVSPSGHVTLLGLGTAPLSRTGPIASPAAFDTAAPELARGDPATAQSDVYAVGALLFRMLSGFAPVPAGSVVKRIRALVKGELLALRDLVPDCPEGLATIIDRALRSAPNERFATSAQMREALTTWLAQSNERAVVARADETLAWALDAIAQNDLVNVAKLLHDRPELGHMAEFTRALWNATADRLLDPLLEGVPLTRIQSILLAHLPEAAPDLIGLVADFEVDESIRVSAARILGAMGAIDASPFLVRVLNEPFPWLRLAALDALGRMPVPQPIGLDRLTVRVIPCRQTWDELVPERDGRRRCDRCDTACVLAPDVEAFVESEFERAPAGWASVDRQVDVMTLNGTRTLRQGEVWTLGSGKDVDVHHPALDPVHAHLHLLSDHRVVVRRMGETIRDGDLEEIAIQIGSAAADGERISIGPVDVMTRAKEAVLVIYAADGALTVNFPSPAVSSATALGGPTAFNVEDLDNGFDDDDELSSPGPIGPFFRKS